jgi:phage-related protein
MLTVLRMAAAAMIAALAIGSASALAQAPRPDANQAAHERFNRFLNAHPAIASELAKNPSLVNDDKFLTEHPGLQKFLETHPAVRKEVAASPGTISIGGGQYEWKPGAGAARGSGNYLLEHPEVAQQLQANPSLLDSNEYVEAHPGLRQFINEHPNLRAEMKKHPYGFVSQRRKGYLPPPSPAQQ